MHLTSAKLANGMLLVCWVYYSFNGNYKVSQLKSIY